MPETLTVERPEPGIALVTLDRPAKLNAIDQTMWEELRWLAEEIERDDSIRVAVVTGAGRGFCAGADLESIAGLPALSVPDFLRFQEMGAQTMTAFRRITTPLIAAVNGPAAGGGLALALCCDVRIAAPDARFNAAFVRLGLSACDMGVSWLLPRVVGFGHASELMLTGRLIDAQEALRIGLVGRVVETEELIGSALGVAREIAANSPFGVRLTKQTLQLSVDAPSLEAALAIENRNQVLASRTEDMVEAVTAFVQRRPPVFSGR